MARGSIKMSSSCNDSESDHTQDSCDAAKPEIELANYMYGRNRTNWTQSTDGLLAPDTFTDYESIDSRLSTIILGPPCDVPQQALTDPAPTPSIKRQMSIRAELEDGDPQTMVEPVEEGTSLTPSERRSSTGSDLGSNSSQLLSPLPILSSSSATELNLNGPALSETRATVCPIADGYQDEIELQTLSAVRTETVPADATQDEQRKVHPRSGSVPRELGDKPIPDYLPIPLRWPFQVLLLCLMAGIFAFVEYELRDLPPLHYRALDFSPPTGLQERVPPLSAEPVMKSAIQATATTSRAAYLSSTGTNKDGFLRLAMAPEPTPDPRPPEESFPTPGNWARRYCGWSAPKWQIIKVFGPVGFGSGYMLYHQADLREYFDFFSTDDQSWCPCDIDSVDASNNEWGRGLWRTNDKGCEEAMLLLVSANAYKTKKVAQTLLPFEGWDFQPLQVWSDTAPPLPTSGFWLYPQTNVQGNILLPLEIRTATAKMHDGFGKVIAPGETGHFPQAYHKKWLNDQIDNTAPCWEELYNFSPAPEWLPATKSSIPCTETPSIYSTVWWTLPMSKPEPQTTGPTSVMSTTSLPTETSTILTTTVSTEPSVTSTTRLSTVPSATNSEHQSTPTSSSRTFSSETIASSSSPETSTFSLSSAPPISESKSQKVSSSKTVPIKVPISVTSSSRLSSLSASNPRPESQATLTSTTTRSNLAMSTGLSLDGQSRTRPDPIQTADELAQNTATTPTQRNDAALAEPITNSDGNTAASHLSHQTTTQMAKVLSAESSRPTSNLSFPSPPSIITITVDGQTVLLPQTSPATDGTRAANPSGPQTAGGGWHPGVPHRPPTGPIPPDIHDSFFNLRSEADYLLASLIPVLLATLLSIPVGMFTASINSLLPFRAMCPSVSGPKSGAEARDSICLPRGGGNIFYSAPRTSLRFLRAFNDPLPLLNLILGVLSIVFVPMSSEILRLEFSKVNCDQLGMISDLTTGPECAYGLRKSIYPIRFAEGILAGMAVVIIWMGLLLKKGKSGVASEPWSVAAVAGLAAALHEPPLSGIRPCDEGDRTGIAEVARKQFPVYVDGKYMPDGEMESELAGMRFKLGYFKGPEGGPGERYGILVVKKRPVDEINGGLVRVTTKSPPQKRKAAVSRYISRTWSRLVPETRQLLVRIIALVLITGLFILILYYEVTILDTPFERFMDSQSFGVRVLFTGFGTAVSSFWEYYFNQVSESQLYQRLASGSQPAQSSINLSPPSNVFVGLWRSFRTRDILSFNIALAALLAKFTPILFSNIPFRNTVTWKMHESCTWMAIVFLAYMILVLLGSIPCWRRLTGMMTRGRWKIPAKYSQCYLPVRPDTISACVYYVCDAKLLRDFAGTSLMGRQERDKLVNGMGKRYVFGDVVGASGKRRVGVDYYLFEE
ncbi:hypothetical protein V8F33_006897 [Rhypophila sp. PSN 637]